MPTASAARIAADRANALHSTGPRTAAGKQRSRLNAIRHGLTAHTILLPAEDFASFTHFWACIAASLHHDGPAKRYLAERIAERHLKSFCDLQTARRAACRRPADPSAPARNKPVSASQPSTETKVKSAASAHRGFVFANESGPASHTPVPVAAADSGFVHSHARGFVYSNAPRGFVYSNAHGGFDCSNPRASSTRINKNPSVFVEG